jgi:glycosidase
MRSVSSLLLLLLLPALATAQNDSVDVTFFYTPGGTPSVVHLPGEFNSWANNSGGTITPNARWTMTKQSDGSWAKTVRLRVGGGSAPGPAYEYKINENGASGGWLADPLNPRTYGSFGNSVIHVRRPTIFPILPKSGGIVASDTVRLVARVFPAVGSAIDTGRSQVLLDGTPVASFGSAYDPATSTLAIAIAGVDDGERVFTVVGHETTGATSRDSTRITVKGFPLQLLSRSNPRIYDSVVTVHGLATTSEITGIVIRGDGGRSWPVKLAGTTFTADVTLAEGDNLLTAAGERDGKPLETQPIVLHRIVDHTPRPVIQFGSTPNRIDLNAFASTDPDGDALTYMWYSEDSLNPAPLGIAQSGAAISFAAPPPGEYYVRLEATDASQRRGVVRGFFRVHEDARSEMASLNDNAQWVKDAIVYEIFPPAFSPSGTLQGIIDRMPYLRDLGVTVLWLTPVMDNPGSINDMNGGYNIIDFYRVDESLGTNADFLRLMDAAHAHGLRVIVDMTPNHTSGDHPWVKDIALWRDHSIYRSFIETRVLGGDRGLGQSVVQVEGYPLYARYTNWSLANINFMSRGAREAMLDVFRYWLRDMRADGYRLDVYWGPQNRYGEKTWWRPFREEMKRIKPEALILGETDGTGPGSEVNFADAGGACDAAYDWSWFGQMKTTMSAGDVGNLHARTSNYSPTLDYNHYTGAHASYMRFLENHDEDRIAQVFTSNVARTKSAAAVMFTTPGMPMLYAGQEVGWKGRRNKIDFNNADRTLLLPWYTRLARVRREHPALRSPRIRLLQHATSAVYAYLRPSTDANIICAASFRTTASEVQLNIGASDLMLSNALDPQRTYYLNDLLSDTTWAVRGADLARFSFALQAGQSRAFLLADSAMFPIVTSASRPDAAATDITLDGAYPHPVQAGDGAVIGFTLPARGVHTVDLAVHDALGRRVATLAAGSMTGGRHSAVLPPSHALAAGVYHLRLLVQAASPGGSVVQRMQRITVLP